MNDSAGSTMDVWYRALFLANHSRSLCRFSCRRNTKTSGLKKAVSAIKIPPVQTSVYRLRSACLYLSPDQYCKLHGIVNGCLQLGTWLDMGSPRSRMAAIRQAAMSSAPRSRSSGMPASVGEQKAKRQAATGSIGGRSISEVIVEAGSRNPIVLGQMLQIEEYT